MKLSLKYSLLFNILAMYFCGHSQTVNYTMEYDGETRDYKLYVPSIYNGESDVPLLLNLHGYTSNMDGQELYGDFRPIADTANFIIVHPNGTFDNMGERYWNAFGIAGGADDIGFLSALVDTVAENYAINLDRVYSAGMSNGGFMSFELACERPDVFAAVASVTGTMPLNRPNTCNPFRPVPIMQIHGTLDMVVPYGNNTSYESVESVIDYWVEQTNAQPDPIEIAVPNNDPNDGTTTTQFIYENGDDGTSIEHFKVENGGHTWPGASINLPDAGNTSQDFSASVEIWRFFSQFDQSGFLNLEKINLENVKFYPNPSTHIVHFENLDFVEKIEVFDLKGVQVASYLTSKRNKSIHHNFEKGVYQVVFSSKNSFRTSKLVVN